MSEHTPTTEQARYAYAHSVMVSGPEMRRELVAEFDRWLDRVRAEARAEGTRESARYIDQLLPAGLNPKNPILADLEVAANRQQRQLHANGRNRDDATVTEASHERF